MTNIIEASAYNGQDREVYHSETEEPLNNFNAIYNNLYLKGWWLQVVEKITENADESWVERAKTLEGLFQVEDTYADIATPYKSAGGTAADFYFSCGHKALFCLHEQSTRLAVIKSDRIHKGSSHTVFLDYGKIWTYLLIAITWMSSTQIE